MKLIKYIVAMTVFSTSFLAAEVIITYGVSTHKNKRPYQEDRFAHAVDSNGQFFGVYDGHGGAHVSELLAKDLYQHFALAKGTLKEQSYGALLKDRLYRAFEWADYESQNTWPNEGSTALAVYIDKKDTMHCAWAGDTRAVLECNGKACFFTADHKPDRKDEKERIERAGGKVYKHGVWRVNGLAVSRSIGDKTCKMLGVGQIIATPEYAQKQLTSDNHFLIMASDGLWDVMNNEEVITLVEQALQQKKICTSIALMLRNLAIAKGSNDNITVCVVKFNWQQESFLRRFLNWLRGK
jgi:protein phosphatase 1L